MTTSTPGLLGQSHIAFSVPDVEKHANFWIDVLGFELLSAGPGFTFLIGRSLRLAVILSDHDGGVTGAFSERQVGLDHYALAVPDAESLRAWEQRLGQLGVPNSGVLETSDGHHLNLRGPDDFPLELYVIGPELLAAVGAAGPEETVPISHS